MAYKIRHKWAWRNGRAVQIVKDGKPTEDYFRAPDVAAPFVITDEMPTMMNHADGEYYSSKSEFRKATRRAGFVEVGNEKQQHKPKELSRRECISDVRDAIERCEAGKGAYSGGYEEDGRG